MNWRVKRNKLGGLLLGGKGGGNGQRHPLVGLRAGFNPDPKQQALESDWWPLWRENGF